MFVCYSILFSSLIKDHWNDKVSVAKNLSNFGLTNDPSKSILTGFTNTQPQVQEDETTIVKNKKVSETRIEFKCTICIKKYV